MINNFFINRNQINLNLNKFFKTIFFKKQYIVKLNNKILKKKYKILHLQLLKISQTQELSEISYILNFSFSKKNLILHIMDYSGNTKFFSSANLLNLKGKQNSFKLNITFRKFYKVPENYITYHKKQQLLG